MSVLENAKQEKFVQNLLNGMSQRQAYLDAFPSAKKWKPETVDTRASELANKCEILARLQELKDAAADAAILRRTSKMVILSHMITDPDTTDKTKLSAIDILNKMDGDYVKRIEATLSTPISDTAAKVAAILDGDAP